MNLLDVLEEARERVPLDVELNPAPRAAVLVFADELRDVRHVVRPDVPLVGPRVDG